MPVTIGILALQGGFDAHACCMRQLDCHTILVRTPQQLEKCKALIIPGGESTALLHLLNSSGLLPAILDHISQGLMIFGTCAGAILLAKHVQPMQRSLNCMDMTIVRNDYGRQLDSFTQCPDKNNFMSDNIELVFIRAPRIIECSSQINVLVRCHGDAVLVEQGPFLAATFHPELTQSYQLHSYFLQKVTSMEKHDGIIQTPCA